MLRIQCPQCGVRDHTEFNYGGDAKVQRPDANCEDVAQWNAYVFERDNPRGPHRELWQHSQGCRCWLEVERNTLSHEILSVRLANDGSVSGGTR